MQGLPCAAEASRHPAIKRELSMHQRLVTELQQHKRAAIEASVQSRPQVCWHPACD